MPLFPFANAIAWIELEAAHIRFRWTDSRAMRPVGWPLRFQLRVVVERNNEGTTSDTPAATCRVTASVASLDVPMALPCAREP